ncbi:MAG: MerR family transcriptional regulator, partial [Thermoleophilia bacterium]
SATSTRLEVKGMSETPGDQLRIGEVARRAGIRTSSIRYYESVGMLPEPDRVAGQRRYSPEILTRLRFIGVAQNAGFSLEEIGQLLDGSGQGKAADPERLQLLARRKLPEVEELLARTEAMKSWLQAAADCKCPTLEDCALFDRPLESAPVK